MRAAARPPGACRHEHRITDLGDQLEQRLHGVTAAEHPGRGVDAVFGEHGGTSVDLLTFDFLFDRVGGPGRRRDDLDYPGSAAVLGSLPRVDHPQRDPTVLGTVDASNQRGRRRQRHGVGYGRADEQYRLTRFAEDMGTDTSAPLRDETCGAGGHHQQRTVTISYLVDDRRRDVVAVHDTQGATDPVRPCVASPHVVDRALGSETTVKTSPGSRRRRANAVPTGIARSEPASMSVAMTTD